MNSKEQLEAMFRAVLETSRHLEESYNALKRKFNELEIKLENNRRYLENILRSINTGVCSVDMDCRVTTFNREACSIFNTTEDSVKGKHISELFGIKPQGVYDLVEMFSTQKKLDVKIDGQRKKLSVSASPIADEEKKSAGAVLIFSDVTRIEELEEENRRKEKLAVIGQMAASIAHDIRNPLASIELLVPLLDDGSKGEIIDNIMISIKRINNIINNTLLFTKNIVYRPEHFDSRGLIDDIELEVMAHVNSKGIAFRKEVDSFDVVADKNLLKSSMVNLIINAIDAAKSSVIVRAYRSDAKRIFEVEDDGEGIPEEERKRIFEPFYTNKKNGTGLGLAIVKEAVTVMGARLEYETSPSGTLFRIVL